VRARGRALAGRDWWDGFLLRWSQVSLRTAEPLHQARAAAEDEATFKTFFDKLRLQHDKHRFLRHNVYNMDETNKDPRFGKVLSCKGKKNVVVISDAKQEEHVTIVGCVSASGDTMPPMIIYKGKQLLPAWAKHYPEAMFRASANGWMEAYAPRPPPLGHPAVRAADVYERGRARTAPTPSPNAGRVPQRDLCRVAQAFHRLPRDAPWPAHGPRHRHHHRRAGAAAARSAQQPSLGGGPGAGRGQRHRGVWPGATRQPHSAAAGRRVFPAVAHQLRRGATRGTQRRAYVGRDQGHLPQADAQAEGGQRAYTGG
jgi:hypothetical protein